VEEFIKNGFAESYATTSSLTQGMGEEKTLSNFSEEASLQGK
jgi:hypothetical protein